MASPRGLPDTPLERDLFEKSYRYEFFQAVRLLEQITPDRKPVGGLGPARDEVVRIGVRTGLAFPPSEIERLSPPATPGQPPGLSVAFLGLTGPLGVLPYCYSELVVDRQRAGDPTLAAFLDLFNHRLASLFYRAWRKYRPAAQYAPGELDDVAAGILHFVGLGLEPHSRRHLFPDNVPLYYSGHFAQRRRSAIALEQILKDYFSLPIEVQQFQGRWLHLEPGDRSTLSASGAFNQLGQTTVLGGKAWDVQGSFRLRLPALSFDQFLSWLPDGQSFQTLVQLVRLHVDAELTFDVQLVLASHEVPPCRLGREGVGTARLGQHAWLKSRPFSRDADQAVFLSEEAENN